MRLRPATLDDVPALAELYERYDSRWFGGPENDESEVRESLELAQPLEDRSRVVLDDEGLVRAAAWWFGGTDSTLLVDPDARDAAALHDALLPWLRQVGAGGAEALDRDTVAVESLQRHGWRFERSSYELIRDVSPDWRLDRPHWPDAVRIASIAPDDAPAVHDLIYRGAGWAQVPGHGDRPFEQWRTIFLPDDVPADQQVAAWRGDRPVGVAVGRTFSDGTGWVAQLAVTADERGHGLGRALLLEAFARRVCAGATRLGLGVSAGNPDALRLYLGVGLEVDREWRRYRPCGPG